MPLKITIPSRELFDERTNEFIQTKEQTLVLEHSLVSISKWESKWCKSFLSRSKDDPLTGEQLLDYVKCMTLTQNVDPDVYKYLTSQNFDEISKYIESPMTATTFHGKNEKLSHHIITSEEIYYWMISLGIPFECQKWHLNRLLTLVRICNIKNSSEKKMSKADVMANNRMLNAQRRAALKSKG